jgi:hypothetical protein
VHLHVKLLAFVCVVCVRCVCALCALCALCACVPVFSVYVCVVCVCSYVLGLVMKQHLFRFQSSCTPIVPALWTSS